MRTIFTVAAIMFPAAALAGLPTNDLHLDDCLHCEGASMTQIEFNRITDEIVNLYKPIAVARGASLVVNKLWENKTVNANASRGVKVWTINMYGGLARRPEVTPDGYALVVCHELGHLFGGFPFYSRSDMSNESQSDYWATQACIRRVWKVQKEENARFADLVDSVAKAKCDAVWAYPDTRNRCYRTAMAGQSLANLLATINDERIPSFSTPDRRVVTVTQEAHQNAQIRLDSYLAGGLCKVWFNINKFPRTESVALVESCKNRPRSWFKPLTY